MSTAPPLKEIYKRLYAQFGPQHWWPATPLRRGGEARPLSRTSRGRPASRFEVMVGAILTQNTNWGNVEKAIRSLRKAKLLSPQSLKKIPTARLAPLIKSSGYFNIKAQRLKSFVDFLFAEYNGDLKRMSEQPADVLRKQLLQVNGIGPETADSILLYALDKPVFVVDAYTKRFLSRHHWINPQASYDEVQKVFSEQLPAKRALFNEYHALIVRLGKKLCKTHPCCEDCPLNDWPRFFTKNGEKVIIKPIKGGRI